MAIECTTKTKRKNVALREHCREVLSETRLLRECSDARYIYSIRLLQFGWKCDQYMRAHTNRTVGAFAHTQISAHRTFRTDTEWELCVFFARTFNHWHSCVYETEARLKSTYTVYITRLVMRIIITICINILVFKNTPMNIDIWMFTHKLVRYCS